MDMPCVATSREGFVCLTVQLITHGYWFYVTGDTRNDRELSPEEIDLRIVRKFDANLPRWKRSDRKARGQCNVRYLRYGKDWVLFSTPGTGTFFDVHKAKEPDGKHRFKDIRHAPLRFHGYQITLSSRGFQKKTPEEKAEYRAKKEVQKQVRERGEEYESIPRGKPHGRKAGRVCIQPERFEELRAEALGLAVHRRADYLRRWFFNQPFLPYAPVRWQLKSLLREVNKARRHAFGPSFEPVPDEAIRFFMKHVPAFKPVDEDPAGDVESSEAA